MSEEHKCKDCKWLTGKKNIRGIECMNPKNQEKWNKAKTLWMGELRKDTARYKQRNAPACKKFEAKEQTMSKDEFKNFDREDLILLIECQKERIGELLADRPQGEWIKHDEERYYCSHCKHIFKTRTITKQDKWTNYIDDLGYNFCPNCGARMRPKLQGKHFDSIIIDECVPKGADDE